MVWVSIMKKKLIYSLAAAMGIWLAALIAFRAHADHQNASHPLPTIFVHSANEKAELQSQHSKELMQIASLQKWDAIAAKFIYRNHLSSYETQRLYTYLYNAEREAAFLSYNAQDCFEGSLDPTAEGILRLFLADYTRPSDYVTDAYSEALAADVLPLFKERLEKENASTKEFHIPESYTHRKETTYQQGIEVAKWTPWVVENAHIPPPPSNGDKEWERQITAIKKAQKNLSEEQYNAIYFWAGLTGTDSGEWRKIGNDYMIECDAPLGKMLLARSTLMTAMYDAACHYLMAKYHYVVIRPQVRDPSISYLINCPMHPSYPSGHSTLAAAASVVLTHYFPENAQEWKRLATESGNSRIWAGIHYPIDNQVGQRLGHEIGEKVLESEED